MKLYRNSERESQFSLHHQQPQENNPNPTSRPPTTKFSFRQSPPSPTPPPLQSALFTQLSHIRIEDEPPQSTLQQPPPIPQRNRSSTPRKKIFPDHIAEPLVEGITAQIQPQNSVSPKQGSRRLTQGNYPASIEINSINIGSTSLAPPPLPQHRQSQPTFGGISPKWTSSTLNLGSKETSKLLAEPILGVERETGQLSPSSPLEPLSKQQESYLKMIPAILQKVEANENEIKQLKDLFHGIISQKERRQKNQEKGELWLQEAPPRREGSKLGAKVPERREAHSEMEKQQSQRLEQLIQENKYLCSKVLEKRMRDSQQDPFNSSKVLEDKIQELRMQRHSIQKEAQFNLPDLDISAIIPQSSKQPFPLSVPPKEVSSFSTQPSGCPGSVRKVGRGSGELRRGGREVIRTRMY